MSCFCGSVWICEAITWCFSFEAIGARFLCNGFELGVMSFFVDLVVMNRSCYSSKCRVSCGSVYIFEVIVCCFSFKAIGARLWGNGFDLDARRFLHLCCNEPMV